MNRYHGRLAAWTGVFLIALSALACEHAEKRTEPAELPDLNEQTRAYVTTTKTKVRSGPGTQFRAIAEIGVDAKVNVVGRDGEWVLIVSKKGNAPGYIEMASVNPWTGEAAESDAESGRSERTENNRKTAKVAGRYEALTDTQVRSGPGLHYPVVADISKGTKLNVVDGNKGWLKVQSKRGNQPGYVEASLTKPTKQ
jgi:N-acetylmuramoyl-L-alanine amidase